MPPVIPVQFLNIQDIGKTTIKAFDCGNKEITDYFHRYALKNHKSGLSPCHVMLPAGASEPILGYATLSSSSLKKGEPPEPEFAMFPNYPIPVILLGRLAISKEHQGQRLGQHFLMHIFYKAYLAVKDHGIGSVGIITDAIDQAAVAFYSKYDFSIINRNSNFPKRMFIPNKIIFNGIDGS